MRNTQRSSMSSSAAAGRSTEEVAARLFEELDTDGDGQISKQEFFTHLVQTGSGTRRPTATLPSNRTGRWRERLLFGVLVLALGSALFSSIHVNRVEIKEEKTRAARVRGYLEEHKMQTRLIVGSLILFNGFMAYKALRVTAAFQRVQPRIQNTLRRINAIQNAPKTVVKALTLPVRAPLRMLTGRGKEAAAAAAAADAASAVGRRAAAKAANAAVKASAAARAA